MTEREPVQKRGEEGRIGREGRGGREGKEERGEITFKRDFDV
jgi:hypothetical protein